MKPERAPSPLLIVLAGPNGAGKTSFYEKVLSPSLGDHQLPVVNPDAMAREAFGDEAEEKAFAAARMADARRRELVERKESFVMETVLSGAPTRKMKFLTDAQAQGYRVHVFFIGLEDVGLSFLRVKQRVEAGGHSIPPELIQSRYPRTLANLATLQKVADELVVFDNSQASEPYRLLARSVAGVSVYEAEHLPAWYRESLNRGQDS